VILTLTPHFLPVYKVNKKNISSYHVLVLDMFTVKKIMISTNTLKYQFLWQIYHYREKKEDKEIYKFLETAVHIYH
jgi:hypothetical protein